MRWNNFSVSKNNLFSTGIRALSAASARLANRFRADRSGAIAVIFGLVLVPMLIGAGVAIDYSRAIQVKARLGRALDSAALAVGSSKETNTAVLQQLAQDYFNANYPAQELGVPGALNVAINNKKITLSASATLDTAVMGLVGIHHMNVNASVEVLKELRRLEIVMVLDNTGSMNSSGKLSALKTAATALVNTLAAEQPDPDMLKFALVPFSAAVNVGTQYKNSGWIDVNKASSLHGIQFKNSKNVFTMFNKLNNKSWNGCVEARPSPYDVLDTVPSNGDTLWVPYFAPDEPDNSAANANGYGNYPNNYLDDKVNGNNTNLNTRQLKKSKYNNKTVNNVGPHYNCANSPLSPLTSNKADILASINAMTAGGYTLIPLGLAWGWRVISPEEPFTQGTAYDDDDTDKAIILLTDGLNNIGAINNHNKSLYNGYGYVAQGRLGTTNSNTAQTKLDTKTTELCNNIKAKGIIVYTITFKLNNAATQNIFRDCASSPSKYFNSPSNSQLQASFEAIAKDLGKLRISK